MTATKRLTIKATRFDPDKDEKPRLQTYEIPFTDDSMVVLDALNYVKGHIDGSLSYRWSCRMGICGSCGMMVDGVPKLTCNAFLRDYWPRPITVEPLNNFPVIRDLVIDMDDFMHKLKAIKPWVIRKQPVPLGGGAFVQTTAQIDEFRQYSQCINCMLCYAACPVYGLNDEFLARPRPRSRAATTSTRGTRVWGSACRSSPTPRACGNAASWASARSCARRVSTRRRRSSRPSSIPPCGSSSRSATAIEHGSGSSPPRGEVRWGGWDPRLSLDDAARVVDPPAE